MANASSARSNKDKPKPKKLETRLDALLIWEETKNKIFEQSEGEKGTLNPNWVELLMGWPMGASSLEPMSKDTFNDWLNGYPFKR